MLSTRHRYTVAPTAKWRDSTVPWRKSPGASELIKKSKILWNWYCGLLWNTIDSYIRSQSLGQLRSSTSTEMRSSCQLKPKLTRHNSPALTELTLQGLVFEVGDKVHLRNNRRLGNKLTPLYSEYSDLGTSVLIWGMVVHKDNIR